MYSSTASLITLFQARAATRPKPEVARVSICLTTAWGRSLGVFGTSIFLGIDLIYFVLLQFWQNLRELLLILDPPT